VTVLHVYQALHLHWGIVLLFILIHPR
jgi:hypothetical protein